MKNQEVTMHEPLIAHTTALRAAGIAISLVSRVPTRLRSIADQVVRSASSVHADLAEGHGRFGKDRAYHWSIAYGSAKEVGTFLRLLVEVNAIEPGAAAKALSLFDQVRAMTWRLIHPKVTNA
jgi:four helix bundle protein